MAVSMRPSEHVENDLVIDGTSVEGFEELYEAYAPRVKGLIRRLIADPDLAADVLQETFLRAFRADLHGESGEDQWPWLATVARNLCLDALRKKSRLSEQDQLDDQVMTLSLVDTHGDPEWHFKALGRREGIAEALASVSPRCRRILLRKHLDGWCYDDIAASEGMSVDAVKSALARARRTFRESYAAIAEHRGLGAALGGALASLRARFQTARHKVAERLSLSAQYMPNPAVFGDAFAAAVVAGAVAVSVGFGGGASVPQMPLGEPQVVREVASSAAGDDGSSEAASPGDGVDAAAPGPAGASSASGVPEPDHDSSPDSVAVEPPDLNHDYSFDTDDHYPGEDPPASSLIDIEVVHEDDGPTGANVQEHRRELDGSESEGGLYNLGVNCSPEAREGSMTATTVCESLEVL